MRRLSSVALVGWCLVGASDAHADLWYTPESTSDGLRFVTVSGEISASDDLSRFARVVQSNSATFVTFNSSGGNIYKAMELGRLIRALGLATLQLRKYGECASACSLAFIGGVARIADAGAIGVHRSSFSPSLNLSTEQAVSSVQAATADIMAYMVEMGVDPSLLQLSLSYGSDDVRYLSASEMERFRVTGRAPSTTGGRSASAHFPPPPAAAHSPVLTPSLDVPTARSGRVRHPKKSVFLKSGPADTSTNLSSVANGTAVEILSSKDRWYQVRAGGFIGYLHHTWVFVDQYESGRFDHRHIQVKSFDNYSDAEAYVRASTMPLAAHLATNGWFAITLAETFPEDTALARTKALKAAGLVPSDTIMTYSNTYVRKVCCD